MPATRADKLMMADFVRYSLNELTLSGSGITARKIKRRYPNKVLKDIFGEKNLATDILTAKSPDEILWIVEEIISIENFIKLFSNKQMRTAFQRSIMLVEELDSLLEEIRKGKKSKSASRKKQYEYLKNLYNKFVKSVRKMLGIKKETFKTRYKELEEFSKKKKPSYYYYDTEYDDGGYSLSPYIDDDDDEDDDYYFGDDEDYFSEYVRRRTKKKSSDVAEKRKAYKSYLSDIDDDDEDDEDEDEEDDLREAINNIQAKQEALIDELRASKAMKIAGNKTPVSSSSDDQRLRGIETSLRSLIEASKNTDANINVIAERIDEHTEAINDIITFLSGGDEEDECECCHSTESSSWSTEPESRIGEETTPSDIMGMIDSASDSGSSATVSMTETSSVTVSVDSPTGEVQNNKPAPAVFVNGVDEDEE